MSWRGAATAGAGGELIVAGAPASSETVGVWANRSTGVFVGAIDDGDSEYESLITGMRVLMCLLPTWRAGAAGAIVGAACSFGTASWANETYGTRSVGSGETVVTGPGVRRAIASGPT